MKKPPPPKPGKRRLAAAVSKLSEAIGNAFKKAFPITIEYSQFRERRLGEHQKLRRSEHNRSLAKKSWSDFNPAPSIIREATKWPNGHKQLRAKARNLRKKRIVDQSNTPSQT